MGKLTEQERNDFMEDLTTIITSLPIIVHACVVSRQGYHNRYLDKYGDNTWEMMKSAFSILVERSVKFVSDKDESIRRKLPVIQNEHQYKVTQNKLKDLKQYLVKFS